MGQAALDRAYDQSAWAPNAATVVARYTVDSEAARAAHRFRTEAYGPTDAEQLQFFTPAGIRPAAGWPLLVFLHGGAWLRLTLVDSAAPAPAALGMGAAFCAVGFANAAAVGVAGMAAQVRRAVEWVLAHADELHVDAGRIVLSGHSSGAHLAACLLTSGWPQPYPFAGAALVSGTYDLYPVLLSSRRSYMKMSEAEAVDLSPIRNLRRLSCPVALARGDRESPEFQRQTDVFGAALAGMGRLLNQRVLPGRNHFEAAEALANPASPVNADLRTLLGV